MAEAQVVEEEGVEVTLEDDKKAINSQEEPVEVQDEQPAEAASRMN